MTAALQAATVGCGRMGAFPSKVAATYTPDFWRPIAHLEAIEQLDGLEIAGAVDIAPATRERVEQRYGKPCYPSLDELFANHAVDILTIATRTPEKIKAVKTALTRGVRAFHIEKPLCNSMRELRELEALLADSLVTYGCFRRYLSPYRDLVAIAQANGLSQLSQVQVNVGRAMLYWSHPHSVDMMLMVDRSDVVGVQAILQGREMPVGFPHTAEDPVVLSGLLRFASGATGVMGTMPGTDLVVGYAEGSLAIENDGHQLTLRKAEGENPYLVSRPLTFGRRRSGGTSAPLRLLAGAINGDERACEEADAAKRDMFRGQAILFAMLQSHARNGVSVSLDRLDPDIACDGLYRGTPA